MSVFPYRREFGPANRPPLLLAPSDDANQGNPLEWARRRRAEREAKRIAAAESRVVHRLGPQWHVVEWPRSAAFLRDLARSTDSTEKSEAIRAGFLAIGPGGIFSVTIAQHGRNKVMIAGDIVQIGGKRPAYIAQARKDAKRAAEALTAAIRQEVPVIPVLAFVGNGQISVNGLPKDCMVTSYQELDKLLASTGRRISAATAQKLSHVASSQQIWVNQPYPGASGYAWHPEGATPGDKGSTQA